VQLGLVVLLEAEAWDLRTASVGENGNEAGNLSDALREVREMAEGARRKAASMEDEILALRGAHAGWSSAIVPGFPKFFEDFKQKQFTLLWRGSGDGFGVDDFHRRRDGHLNTQTMILDTDGNIFGGFTAVFLMAMKIVHPVTKSNSELGCALQKKRFTNRVIVLFEILT
jgi:hypothetical protein